jgi:hypothetical protein
MNLAKGDFEKQQECPSFQAKKKKKKKKKLFRY